MLKASVLCHVGPQGSQTLERGAQQEQAVSACHQALGDQLHSHPLWTPPRRLWVRALHLACCLVNQLTCSNNCSKQHA